MTNNPKNNLEEMVTTLENLLTDLNNYSLRHYPDGREQEVEQIESIYVNIRNQKKELEKFLLERSV